MKVKFENIICRVEGKVNAQTTDIPNYLGKGHGECGEIAITQHGDLLKDRATLGMAFRFSFKKGDVLFMSRSFSNRKAGMAMFDGICSEKTFVLRTKDGNILLQKYLPLIIQNDEFWEYCEENKAGGVNNFINWKTIANYELDIPSIEEQKIIANKTWAAYRLKEGYKKLLAATDEMVKSQFIEMFGDCVNRIKLSSLCSTFVDGDWIESKDQSELGIRLIQTGNVGNGFFKDKEDKSRYISEESFDNLHCTEIYPGDILVSRLPDPIGRACIIPQGLGRTITAVDCTIIRLKDIILPDYFIAYTMTPSYVAQINEVTTGTTRRRVSRANLGNILIPCPSIAKQQQFVAIAKQADKSKSHVLKALKETEILLQHSIRQVV